MPTGTITGGFTTTSPIHVGDAWEAQFVVDVTSPDAPSVIVSFPSSLGATVHVSDGGSNEGDVSNAGALFLTGDTFPVTVTITGTAADVDTSATLTVELSDGGDLDTGSDSIVVGGPPLAGGFTTTSPIEVGDAWEFTVDIDTGGLADPTLTVDFDASLGLGAHLTVNDATATTVFDDDITPFTAPVPAGTSPFTAYFSGVAASVDSDAELTVDLLDDTTPVDTLTDSIAIDSPTISATGHFSDADGGFIDTLHVPSGGPWHFVFSIDGPASTVFARFLVLHFAFAAGFADRLCPATLSHISTDGGATWSPASPGFTISPSTITDVGYYLHDLGADGTEVVFDPDTLYMISGTTSDLGETYLSLNIEFWNASHDVLASGGGAGDGMVIVDVGPPPATGTGVVELELVDGDGARAFIDVSDMGVQAGTVSCQRGCSLQGPYFRQDAGRATWTLDNDLGQWDPMVTTNPWWQGDPDTGSTLLTKGLRARIFVRHPDRDEGALVWSGRVTEWPPNYDADRWSEVPVVCLDAVDRLKAASRPALGDPVGAGEGVSARVARILFNIGYSADPVTDGDVTLQGTTLARSVWEELALVADSDGGWLYLDANGAPRYLKRDWFIDALPVLTLSMGGEEGTLEYANPQTTNDTDELYNVLKLARAGGVEQAHIADDADPDDETGYRTYSRDDLISQTDRQVMDLVLFTIGRTRHARFRFSTVEVPLRADMTPEQWDQVTDRDFGDIIQIRHTTVDGRILEVNHILMGIAWPTIDPGRKQWTARFTLAELPADQPLLEIDGSGDDGVFHLGQRAPWR